MGYERIIAYVAAGFSLIVFILLMAGVGYGLKVTGDWGGIDFNTGTLATWGLAGLIVCSRVRRELGKLYWYPTAVAAAGLIAGVYGGINAGSLGMYALGGLFGIAFVTVLALLHKWLH